MDLLSISEIENVQSVSSPHEEELKKFGNKWVEEFRDFDEKDLEKVAGWIGGFVNDIGVDEEWTLSKEFYPCVSVHVSYHYYGEEFSSLGEEDAVRFLFSGEKVREVTGEDLAGMIEIMLNFIGRIKFGDVCREDEVGEKELEEKYYEPRKVALDYLDINDDKEMKELSKYIGGEYEQRNSKRVLKKEFFQEVELSIELDNNLKISYSGNEIKRLTGRDLDLLAVYTLNHVIRFISERYSDEDLPVICEKVFPK